MIKTREELIRKYIDFFKSKNHKEIPSASVIPENDPTVLFTTAGMHPLVPFLIGQKHPLGRRLVSVQKCIRTGDINEVGDEVHHTFFEMLGNWSFGEYWKKEAIEFSFEFLTSDKWLGISKEKLAVTCFAGDKNAPRDEESAGIWESFGITKKRIVFLPKENNWWGPAGETGPCGPDTEMFIWVGKEKAPEKFNHEDKKWIEIWNDVFMQYKKKKRIILVDGMHCLYDENFKINKELLKILQSFNTKKIVVVNRHKDKAEKLVREAGYEVFSFDGKIKKDNEEFFNELLEKYDLKKDEVIYFEHGDENIKTANNIGITKTLLYEGNIKKVEKFIKENICFFAPLNQKNVDTGMGVERTLAVLNGLNDNYLTSIFGPIIKEIEKISGKKYRGNEKEIRIIADHLRAATFILGDERGIKPANVGQGYVIRRLIRGAVRYGKILGIKENFTAKVAQVIESVYRDYSELAKNRNFILTQLDEEENKFNSTLEKGLKKFEEIIKESEKIISGKNAFLLFQSYGFPIEMTLELAHEQKKEVDTKKFEQEFRKHQELSRTASAGAFKSGLADNSAQTTKLHTATHLLNESLRRILGNEEIKQKGSNINVERLRFDFSFSRKLSEEEIKKVEELVNEKISENLKIVKEEMPIGEALKSGAQAEFGAKYPEIVSVYTITDKKEKREWFSKEICTGPHVSNTKEIGKFKIIKEEAIAAGVRRIKAIV